MDTQLEKVTKWYSPEGLIQEKAFKELQSLIKNVFIKSKVGIRFFWINKFLEENGISDKTVRLAGFETVSHFLFHCDHLLEVRGKKMDGKIIYFLFIQEKVRRAEEEADTEGGSMSSLSTHKENLSEAEVYHHTTFPSSVLNLYRDVLIHTEEGDTTFCVKVKSKDERIKAAKKKSDEKPKVDIVLEEDYRTKHNTEIRDLNSSVSPSMLRLAHAPEFHPAIVHSNQPIVQILRSHVFDQPNTPQNRYRVLHR